MKLGIWYNVGMWYGIEVIVAHYKSKANWYLKYLTWGFVIIVCFAILVHVFKDTNCLATWLFNFFSTWAIVLGAIATLGLVLGAFLAIMDNRHSRILDRRERRLNEIIEWATDICRCGVEQRSEKIMETYKKLEGERLSQSKKKGLLSPEHQRLLQDLQFDIGIHLSKLTNSFVEFRPKNRYIQKVAGFMGKTLQEKVSELIDEVEAHIKLLEKCQTAPNIVTKLGAAPRHKEKLDKLALSVIEEATKIKIEEII